MNDLSTVRLGHAQPTVGEGYCQSAVWMWKNRERRRLKLTNAWQLASGKGHTQFTLISARDSAHVFSVKFSPSVCVAIEAVLTREMAAICQHLRPSISGDNYTAWVHEVLLTTLMEQQTVTNPAVMQGLCAITNIKSAMHCSLLVLECTNETWRLTLTHADLTLSTEKHEWVTV